MGRTTPSRTAGGSSSRSSSSTASQHKFAYGYEQQQQQQTVQQLGEFFTATSLKVPQRYGERVADSRQGSCRGQVSCTHARKPQVLQETDELAQNAGFDHRAHVSSSVLSKHGCLQGPARCCRILELACSAGLIAGSARLSMASAHGMHPCLHSNNFTGDTLNLHAEQSPYLKSSSRSPQATSGNLTSPRSPSSKSSSTTVGNSGSYSRQQLGSLYSSSPDPVGRMKMGLSSTSASKVCVLDCVGCGCLALW